MASARSRAGRIRSSARRYAGGVRLRELPGLWRRDWRRAYSVLTRDHPEEEEPRGWLRRGWYRTKNLFLDLSYRLPPARRLLFALCLIFALIGLQTEDVKPQGEVIEVLEHPVFLVLSIVGLLFLLVLELADRIVFRDELEVARQLQNDLLPKQAPEIDGYEFAFSYRSANTVGGDYYDFLPLADGRLALAVADASGHGIAAAMLMAISNATLKLAVDTDPAPIAVARMMNRALVATGGPRQFLTLFYTLLDPPTGALEFVCAGHPFPLLRRHSGELVRLGSGSLPLGLRRDLEPSSGAAEIEPGELLLLYSDGIPEAVSASGDAFGFDRVERSFALGGSAAEVHDRILAELSRFEGAETPRDDRSLVVIRRET